jgi:hypothetical protein
MLSSNMYNILYPSENCCRVPYMGKGTFSIIVNQTESKAKTPTTDSQFLIPGFPASKLRAEKMVLSSYGLKLSNGKGKVITHPKTYPKALGFKNRKLQCANKGALLPEASSLDRKRFFCLVRVLSFSACILMSGFSVHSFSYCHSVANGQGFCRDVGKKIGNCLSA